MNAKEEVALMRANFNRRAKANKGKQVDNSRLPAGSNMYYYCRHCGAPTGVTAESSWSCPPSICTPCKEMARLGLL